MPEILATTPLENPSADFQESNLTDKSESNLSKQVIKKNYSSTVHGNKILILSSIFFGAQITFGTIIPFVFFTYSFSYLL